MTGQRSLRRSIVVIQTEHVCVAPGCSYGSHGLGKKSQEKKQYL